MAKRVLYKCFRDSLHCVVSNPIAKAGGDSAYNKIENIFNDGPNLGSGQER